MTRRGKQIFVAVILVLIVLFVVALITLVISKTRAQDTASQDEKFNQAFALEVRQPTPEDRDMAKRLCQLLQETDNPLGVIDEIVNDTILTLDTDGARDTSNWMRISIQTYCPEFDSDLKIWAALNS